MLPNLVWKEIPEYPKYLVSNYGRIWSRFHSRELESWPGSNNMYRVQLVNENGKQDLYVHRLVAEAFFPYFDKHRQLAHVNGDTSDNAIWNLRYKKPDPKISSRPRGLFWGKGVRVVETGEVYSSVEDCAQGIGGARSHIYAVLRGERKTHLGYSYEWC